MSESLRHLVGRTCLSGYVAILPEDESLFAPAPELDESQVTVVFDDGQRIEARLFRSKGAEQRLKLAYTGEAGAAFRSWLKRRFPARKSSKVRGVLVLTRKEAGLFLAQAESVKQAEVELITPSARRYLHGAKPICILHPAMGDLEACLSGVQVPSGADGESFAQALTIALGAVAWVAPETVGGGLALAAGLRRQGAQVHLVLDAAALYPALLSLAVAFDLAAIDLGVLLVADARVAERTRAKTAPVSSLKRALREAESLGFLVRGPTCLLGLSSRKQIR